MKAPASVVGNHVAPVRVAMVAAPIPAVTATGRPARIIWTGLYPRSAAKSAPVGGIALIDGMSEAAPAPVSEAESAWGNSFVRPTTMMVKNIPMLMTKPEFIRVDIMPEATPRSDGGTEFMIAAEFGEANMPFPIPMTKRATAKGR